MARTYASIIKRAHAEAARIQQGDLETSGKDLVALSLALHAVAEKIGTSELRQLDALIRTLAMMRSQIDEVHTAILDAATSGNVLVLTALRLKVQHMADEIPGGEIVQPLCAFFSNMATNIRAIVQALNSEKDGNPSA